MNPTAGSSIADNPTELKREPPDFRSVFSHGRDLGMHICACFLTSKDALFYQRGALFPYGILADSWHPFRNIIFRVSYINAILELHVSLIHRPTNFGGGETREMWPF